MESKRASSSSSSHLARFCSHSVVDRLSFLQSLVRSSPALPCINPDVLCLFHSTARGGRQNIASHSKLAVALAACKVHMLSPQRFPLKCSTGE
eukprot:6402411-Amphidinium_carterae.1